MNLRSGRSTRKLHRLVPSSRAQDSRPVEARFLEEFSKDAAARPGWAVRKTKAPRPPTSSGTARRDKCDLLKPALRSQRASAAPRARPSRLHQVEREARFRGSRPNCRVAARTKGVTAQMSAIRTFCPRLENLRMTAGQSM